MTREIVISNPKLNTYNSYYRRYSYNEPDRISLPDKLDSCGVTPRKFPKACELFAGDAPVAATLISRGWEAQNVSCFDIAISPTPLVNGVDWQFWDLRQLIVNINYGNGEGLPEKVSKYQKNFDIVFSFWDDAAFFTDWDRDDLVEFFLKPGGLKFIR